MVEISASLGKTGEWRLPSRSDTGFCLVAAGGGLAMYLTGRLGYPHWVEPASVLWPVSWATMVVGVRLMRGPRSEPGGREAPPPSMLEATQPLASAAGNGADDESGSWKRDVQRVVKAVEDNKFEHLRLFHEATRADDQGRLERLSLRSQKSGFFHKFETRKSVKKLLTDGLIPGQWTMSFDSENDLCHLVRKVAFANPLLIRELPPVRAMTAQEAIDRYEDFRLNLGKDETGSDVLVNLNDYPHLLTIGGTGSGKSEFNKWCLTQFLAAGFVAFLMDGKNSDFSGLSKAPNVAAVSRNPAEHAKLVQILVDELNRRRAVGSRRKQLGVRGWNAFPPIVVIGDELATIREEVEALYGGDETFVQNVNLLLRQGRQFRIHILFATQELYAATVPGAWRANLGTRISLGPPEPNTIQYGFTGQETRQAVNDIGKLINQQGRGVLVDNETKLVTEFQAPYAYSHKTVIDDVRDPLVRENWKWMKRELVDRIPKLYPRIWFKAEAPPVFDEAGVEIQAAGDYKKLTLAELAELDIVALDDPKTLEPIPDMSKYDPFSEHYVAMERGDEGKGLGFIE